MDNNELKDSVEKMKKDIQALQKNKQEDKLAIFLFSGDIDKVMGAMMAATAAAASGTKVEIFAFFWAVSTFLEPKKKSYWGKDLMGKMFGMMMPYGAKKLGMSKMNMAGMGPVMIDLRMKQTKTTSVPELIKLAEELDVQLNICELTMKLMGFKREEMMSYNGLKYLGMASFLQTSMTARATLFI